VKAILSAREGDRLLVFVRRQSIGVGTGASRPAPVPAEPEWSGPLSVLTGLRRGRKLWPPK
jgi:hypothetical protein